MRRISVGMIFLLGIAAVVVCTISELSQCRCHCKQQWRLVVSWDERGLGEWWTDGNVSYTLTADAHATYGCINGGGNHPKASTKRP